MIQINQRFGTLIVTAFVGVKSTHKCYSVKCDCGNVVSNVFGFNLLQGKTSSCGKHKLSIDGTYTQTNKKEKEFHNSTNSPTYRSWSSMISRCMDPRNPDFKHYGGRGITVHEEWLKSYQAFVDHIGERPLNTTIDRINVNKNYEPGNVRWASLSVQNSNKRSKRLTQLQQIFK